VLPEGVLLGPGEKLSQLLCAFVDDVRQGSRFVAEVHVLLPGFVQQEPVHRGRLRPVVVLGVVLGEIKEGRQRVGHCTGGVVRVGAVPAGVLKDGLNVGPEVFFVDGLGGGRERQPRDALQVRVAIHHAQDEGDESVVRLLLQEVVERIRFFESLRLVDPG
jgi:hypothetical protein